MYTSIETAKRLYEQLDKDMTDLKSMQEFQSFKFFLEGTNNSKVGNKLPDAKVSLLMVQASTALSMYCQNFLDNNQISNEEYNQKVLAVADYLFLCVLNTTGCPNFPRLFGSIFENNLKSRFKEINTNVNRNTDYSNIRTDAQFNLQRRKSANQVRTETSEYFNHTENNPISPTDLAKFTAEYQALKLRQAGHGRIWRFFHRKENERRTELLADMKAKIEEYIGGAEDIDIDNAAPEEVAEYLEEIRNPLNPVNELSDEKFAQRNNCDINELLGRENESAINNANKINGIVNKHDVSIDSKNEKSVALSDDDDSASINRYVNY